MNQYNTPGMIKTFWWKDNKDEVYKNIFSYVNFLDKRQSYREENNLRHLRLYANSELLGMGITQYARSRSTFGVQHRITLNIIQSMCDTVTSKITKNSPRVRFLTSGGNYSLRRKAEKLTKYIDGQFYATQFPQKASEAFRHASIFGTGAVKIFIREGKICAEKVFIEELKMDDSEAIYGEPRQMHQVKFIHKEVLKEMFGNDTDIAIKIDTIPNEYLSIHQDSQSSDMVKVIESWHLPSGEGASDGRHTICVGNCDLVDEEYKKNYFPFVFFRWGVRPLGFFGQGLAEQLQGIQLEMNKILRTIQISMHLTCIPKVFVEATSKVIKAHINNEIGGIVSYTGVKPTYEDVGSISGELFAHLDRLYQRGYEIAGISQLSANSAKPAGLDSGKALREYNDIETERFLEVGRRYEYAFIEAAKIMIDLGKELYGSKDEIPVKIKGDKFLETISWADIDLEEDEYIMEPFPVSALSNSPSARIADVQELMAAGLIDPTEGKKLLRFPDLEASSNLENAAIENIDKLIEKFADKGEYDPPEPYQNLALGISKMQEAYLMYKNENLDDENLELFRRWIEDANALILKAQTEQQQRQLNAQAQAQAQLNVAQAAEVAREQGPITPEEQASMEPVPQEELSPT